MTYKPVESEESFPTFEEFKEEIELSLEKYELTEIYNFFTGRVKPWPSKDTFVGYCMDETNITNSDAYKLYAWLKERMK